VDRSPSLLLVDDEPFLGVIVGRLARRLGLETTCAADVSSAWECLTRQRPELVLLDVNLPGASGIELLRRLRHEDNDEGGRMKDESRQQTGALSSSFILHPSSFSSVPVALFCQPTQTEDITAGWRAGADYLLPKDLVARPDEWHRRMEEILAHARGQAALHSLTCQTTASGQTSWDWATAVEQVLERRDARSLGEEIPALVLRRALDRAFASLFDDNQIGRWLLAGEARLNRLALPPSVPKESVRLCFASLVDQWRCLLGSEASKSLVEALQAIPF
jgi:DNA-binding response OmpR family regulator